jgi:hypothetical protein
MLNILKHHAPPQLAHNHLAEEGSIGEVAHLKKEAQMQSETPQCILFFYLKLKKVIFKCF